MKHVLNKSPNINYFHEIETRYDDIHLPVSNHERFAAGSSFT